MDTQTYFVPSSPFGALDATHLSFGTSKNEGESSSSKFSYSHHAGYLGILFRVYRFCPYLKPLWYPSSRHCVTCDSWVLTEEEAMAMQNSAAAAAVSTATANVPRTSEAVPVTAARGTPVAPAAVAPGPSPMSLNLSKIQVGLVVHR